MDQNFRFRFYNELRIDTRSIVRSLPLASRRLTCRGAIYTHLRAPLHREALLWNSAAPSSKATRRLSSDKRVAANRTAGSSLELSGPRQFMETGRSPEVDRRPSNGLRAGDIDSISPNVNTRDHGRKAGKRHPVLPQLHPDAGCGWFRSADYGRQTFISSTPWKPISPGNPKSRAACRQILRATSSFSPSTATGLFSSATSRIRRSFVATGNSRSRRCSTMQKRSTVHSLTDHERQR